MWSPSPQGLARPMISMRSRSITVRSSESRATTYARCDSGVEEDAATSIGASAQSLGPGLGDGSVGGAHAATTTTAMTGKQRTHVETTVRMVDTFRELAVARARQLTQTRD